MRTRQLISCTGLAAALLLFGALPVGAQATSCPDDFCDDPIDTICDPGGFQVELVSFDPANMANSGCSTFTYQICSPPAGTCSLDPTRSCLDNSKCDQFNAGTCDRACAVDTFRGLSHFDVFFPELGAGSCLSDNADIGGTCSCTDGSSPGCSVVGAIVLGDGSCFGPTTPVAKCDETNLAEGDCIEMALEICGEQAGLGAGGTVVVSKESGDCNESCLLGPSCEPCDGDPGGGPTCLTRTRGFWGTHPHITELFLPVEACGEAINVTEAGVCDSSSEALCTSARDNRKNPTYLSLVAQLTAAQINLAATATFGGSCSGFSYDGESIQQIIDRCEGFCDAKKQIISQSGCIEALDAFNNSLDSGFDVDPAPFDRPGPAQPGECQEARGNGTAIGKGDCAGMSVFGDN